MRRRLSRRVACHWRRACHGGLGDSGSRGGFLFTRTAACGSAADSLLLYAINLAVIRSDLETESDTDLRDASLCWTLAAHQIWSSVNTAASLASSCSSVDHFFLPYRLLDLGPCRVPVWSCSYWVTQL